MSALARMNGRIPHDYHTHTDLSCDSEATMAQMCQRALDAGIPEIAFTDHFDAHPKDDCSLYYDAARAFELFAAVREQFAPQGLTVRAGVELGEPHRFGDAYAPVLAQYPYDIVLGSLHWLGDNLLFDRSYLRAHEADEVYAAYFSELAQMVRTADFDVVAHADVFKRVGFTIYGAADTRQWEDWVRPVWQACIERGTGVEINTACLRRGLDQMHPSLPMLRWYHDMGGEILTLGSDGHSPDQLGFALAQAVELARAAGFTRVAVYERRQVVRWEPI